MGLRRLPEVLVAAGFGIQTALWTLYVGGNGVPADSKGQSGGQHGSVAPQRASAYFPRYEDVADRAGLRTETVNGGVHRKTYFLETVGGGIALLDYDNDGWLDIFVVNGSRVGGFPQDKEPSNHLYHNNHNGIFTDRTKEAGLIRSGWGQAACVGDYDGDGYQDLFVTYYGPNVLYHNNGNGTFTDVTRKAGLFQAENFFNSGCAFLDYDRDGSLDLFVANSVAYQDAARLPPNCNYKGLRVNCGPLGLLGSKNFLYHNNGDGTFTDVSTKTGIRGTEANYSWSVCSFDYDDDGWPDIYVTNDSTPSFLYHNNRDGTFSEVGMLAGVAYNLDGFAQASMGAATGDYDCDGHLDLFRTNFIDDTSTLFRNLADGAFMDVTFPSGLGTNTRFLGWGTSFYDMDNDGWPDLLSVAGHVYPEIAQGTLQEQYNMRKVLYRDLGNGRFEDISLKSGPGILLERCSRGAAFGDIFNTGQIDIVINNMNDTPTLLRNVAPSANHWILVRLVGQQTNRSAIGSRVTVRTGEHRQTAEVQSGCSFCSQNDLRLHFGLGKNSRVDNVDVRWLSGREETYRDLPADCLVTIVEGKGIESLEQFGKVP